MQPPAAAASSSMSSRGDEASDRIRRNFYAEAQTFRKRIMDAADETARAHEKVQDSQHEMLRMKKKCFKLQKLLQERESTIQSLREQQDLMRFPALMDETVRGLQSFMHEDGGSNQSEATPKKSDTPSLLSSSVRQEQANNQTATDERIHEYEQQVGWLPCVVCVGRDADAVIVLDQVEQLYAELQEEKLKNDMLSECLQEQKKAKHKLMKTCKYAKQELDVLRNNGMGQMLDDMSAKYQNLQSENVSLTQTLQEETGKVNAALIENETLQQEIADWTSKASEWEETRKEHEAERQKLREQIRIQQKTLENMEFDFRNLGLRRSLEATPLNEDAQEEHDLLVRALHQERKLVKEMHETIGDLKAEVEQLQQSSPKATRIPHGTTAGVPSSQIVSSMDKLKALPRQTQEILSKVRGLSQLLKSYMESGMVDMHFLFEDADPEESPIVTRPNASADDFVHATHKRVLDCDLCLTDVQHMLEDALARVAGSNCALQ